MPVSRRFAAVRCRRVWPWGCWPPAPSARRRGLQLLRHEAPSLRAPVPAGEPVARELFGTHVGNLASGAEPLPPAAGAIRLWDSGVSWRQLEPVQGQIDWAPLDSAVAQAEKIGAADILWVHGSPPPWAALDPEAPGIYGPGTSSAPDQEAYLSILRQVAERYRGRITSYQVWNEANIKIFYRGKPDYLAELTLRAKEVLDEVDPDALLVGASTTVRAAGPVKPWYGKYSAALAERGWPVDAMAVHLYPLADQGAGTRAAYVRLMRAWLAERGWTGPALGHRDQLRRPPRLRQGEGRRAAGAGRRLGGAHVHRLASPWASTGCTGTRGTTTSSASTRWTPRPARSCPPVRPT